MESDSNSLSALDLILQARLLLEIILHPTSCLAVLQNWHAFHTTKMPEKLMYFASCVWVDLPSEAMETIKRCFERKGMATKVDIHGVQVVANLLGMVLVDSSGRMRSIAWIDEDGKSFFPKKVLGGGIVRAPQILEEPRPSFSSIIMELPKTCINQITHSNLSKFSSSLQFLLQIHHSILERIHDPVVLGSTGF